MNMMNLIMCNIAKLCVCMLTLSNSYAEPEAISTVELHEMRILLGSENLIVAKIKNPLKRVSNKFDIICPEFLRMKKLKEFQKFPEVTCIWQAYEGEFLEVLYISWVSRSSELALRDDKVICKGVKKFQLVSYVLGGEKVDIPNNANAKKLGVKEGQDIEIYAVLEYIPTYDSFRILYKPNDDQLKKLKHLISEREILEKELLKKL